jgi:hypothetical protein
MYIQANENASFIFEYDPSLGWTENCKRRAYAIVASVDHEIVEPSDDPEGDAVVAKWERDSAAETLRHWEADIADTGGRGADRFLTPMFIKARRPAVALNNVVQLRRPHHAPAPKPSGLLKLTWVHQTEDDDERQWLVYGMFAKGEMSVLFGEPSAGKSIVADDVAFHVAHAMPWFGMETSKTTVLYYAAERAKLVKRRLRGLEDYHEINDLTRIVIGSGGLDIRNERDTGLFINDIRRASDESGEDVGLVILDTFSRSLNGGDENSQSDVGDAVKNMQRIVDETGVHLMAIHHVGVSMDAKKRMRGSSVLTGGIDKSFLVTQPKKGEIIIAGVKDNDPVGDGAMPPLKMLIRAFKTGTDASGRDLTVPYLTLPDTPDQARRQFTFANNTGGPKLTAAEKDARAARTALANAIEEHGVLIVDDAAGSPDGVTTVSKEQWRAAFEAEDASGRTPDALRMAFNRALKTAIETGQVNARNDHFWLSE